MSPRPSRPAIHIYRVFVATTLLALLLIPARAHALKHAPPPAPPGTISLGPDKPAASGPRRFWIVRTVSPGQSIRVRARLANPNGRAARVQLFSADAHSETNGAFVPTSYGTPVHEVGAWMHIVGPTSVVVPAHSIRRVWLRISVPSSAQPGLHVGALIERGQPQPVKVSSGQVFRMIVQVGLRFYITVPGHAIVKPEWSGFVCRADDGAQLCTVTLHNAGTVALAPTGSLTVQSWWGNTIAALSIPSNGDVLPGSQATYAVRWDHPIIPGPYTAHATLSVRHKTTNLGASLFIMPTIGQSAGALAIVLLLALLIRTRRRFGAAWHAWHRAPRS